MEFYWHPRITDLSIRLPDNEVSFISPKNTFPLFQSPVTVYLTPLQPMLGTMHGDVSIVSRCLPIETHVMKLQIHSLHAVVASRWLMCFSTPLEIWVDYCFFFFGKAAVAPRCFLVTISEQLNRANFRPVTRTKSSVWVSANHRYVYVCTYVSQAMYYVGICKKCVMFTLCILYLTIKLGGGGLGGSVTSKEAAKLVTIIIRQLDFSAFVVCRQPIMFSSTQPSLYVPKPNQNMGTVLWQERNR